MGGRQDGCEHGMQDGERELNGSCHYALNFPHARMLAIVRGVVAGLGPTSVLWHTFENILVTFLTLIDFFTLQKNRFRDEVWAHTENLTYQGANE